MPETSGSSNTMDMETMSRMLATLMQGMKQADAVESQKREQAHSATRCLRKVLEKIGQLVT